MALRKTIKSVGVLILLFFWFHASGGLGEEGNGASTVHSQRTSSVWYKVTESRSPRPKLKTLFNKTSHDLNLFLKLHDKPFEKDDRNTNGYIPRTLPSCKIRYKKKTKRKLTQQREQEAQRCTPPDTEKGKISTIGQLINISAY